MNARTVANFISGCKNNKEAADKVAEQVQTFCQAENIILIKPVTDIHPLKLLEGYQVYLEAQEQLMKVKSARGAEQDIKVEKDKYYQLLKTGTEKNSFHCHMTLLHEKSLHEIDDISQMDILNRITIAKHDLDSFYRKFGPKAALFSALMYAVLAASLTHKIKSAKEFADIMTNLPTNKPTSAFDAMLKATFSQFTLFKKQTHQQTHRLGAEEISYCISKADQILNEIKDIETDTASIIAKVLADNGTESPRPITNTANLLSLIEMTLESPRATYSTKGSGLTC